MPPKPTDQGPSRSSQKPARRDIQDVWEKAISVHTLLEARLLQNNRKGTKTEKLCQRQGSSASVSEAVEGDSIALLRVALSDTELYQIGDVRETYDPIPSKIKVCAIYGP